MPSACTNYLWCAVQVKDYVVVQQYRFTQVNVA